MIHVQSPSVYVTVQGEIRTVPSPPWLFPRLRYQDGAWWEETPHSDEWLRLGWVARPTTRWGRFRHHVLAGLLNGYPLRDVLWFALQDWTDRRG